MTSTVRLLIACVVAFAALHVYGWKKVDASAYDLDPAMKLGSERWRDQAYTASSIGDMEQIVARERTQAAQPAPVGCSRVTMLWLGNSQLHHINQFEPGDRLAPYWLRRAFRCPDTTVPLGFSLPNANLQEHYMIARYVSERIPLRVAILELVFDDLREDGLRNDFASMLTPDDRQRLHKDAVARDIVARAETDWSAHTTGEENAGLHGFVQKRIEDALNEQAGRISTLWADRANLRVRVLTDLYVVRNKALGIKATTVRKMIPDRYRRNMQALEEMLAFLQSNGTSTVAYIAPIRQDHPLPYRADEYAAWKESVQALARRYEVTLLNLETLVPPQFWGVYYGDEIDFMHFRGPGHKMLGETLLPYVQPLTLRQTAAAR